jgi:hypothetical protein
MYLIIGLILSLGILIFIFLFMTVGIKQIVSENILEPSINATLTATSSLLDNNTINNVNALQTQYDTDWFNYDLFFILIFIIYVSQLFYLSAKTKIDNIFTFMGFATFGNMIFLFALTFIDTIREWLTTNLYYNLFDLSLINTPIIDFVVTNIQFISFILFVVCVLISGLDWQVIKEKITGNNSVEVEE